MKLGAWSGDIGQRFPATVEVLAHQIEMSMGRGHSRNHFDLPTAGAYLLAHCDLAVLVPAGSPVDRAMQAQPLLERDHGLILAARYSEFQRLGA